MQKHNDAVVSNGDVAETKMMGYLKGGDVTFFFVGGNNDLKYSNDGVSSL